MTLNLNCNEYHFTQSSSLHTENTLIIAISLKNKYIHIDHFNPTEQIYKNLLYHHKRWTIKLHRKKNYH